MRQLVGAVLAATLTSCGTTPVATIAPMHVQFVPYTTPPHVTGDWPTTCQAQGVGPDPVCTPGSVSSTDKAEVCAAGFSNRHRPTQAETDAAKTRAMLAYQIPMTQRDTVELDHHIPVALGGSNDATNLWAQPSDLPGEGWRNSKDTVETRIWRAVCRPGRYGPKITLEAAQQAIARDWTTAVKALGLKETT